MINIFKKCCANLGNSMIETYDQTLKTGNRQELKTRVSSSNIRKPMRFRLP